MYQETHKTTLRSEWCEFSLRKRPARVKPFQAGVGEQAKRTKRENKTQSVIDISSYRLRSNREENIEHDTGIRNCHKMSHGKKVHTKHFTIKYVI